MLYAVTATHDTPASPTSPIPPAFQRGNPHRGSTPGQAPPADMTQALSNVLSQLAAAINTLPAMVAAAVQQAMNTGPCGACLQQRFAWDAAHAREIQDAVTQAMTAHGITDMQEAIARRLDYGEYLPEHLRPGQPGGVPTVLDAAITIGGTRMCQPHAIGQRPQGTGQTRRALLLAPPGMSVHAAAAAAAGGLNMPGIPSPPGQ